MRMSRDEDEQGGGWIRTESRAPRTSSPFPPDFLGSQMPPFLEHDHLRSILPSTAIHVPPLVLAPTRVPSCSCSSSTSVPSVSVALVVRPACPTSFAGSFGQRFSSISSFIASASSPASAPIGWSGRSSLTKVLQKSGLLRDVGESRGNLLAC